MKIIFLDKDGVLNFQNHYEIEGYSDYRDAKKRLIKDIKKNRIDKLEYHKTQINFDALKRIEKLCEITKAKIVISASMRKNNSVADIHDMFRYCGLEKDLPIIDLTPIFPKIENCNSFPRGCEIEYWLNSKGYRHDNHDKEALLESIINSGIENYIIIDDGADMLYNQRNHLVHIPPAPIHNNGFDDHYLDIAVKKLIKDAIELNFQ